LTYYKNLLNLEQSAQEAWSNLAQPKANGPPGLLIFQETDTIC